MAALEEKLGADFVVTESGRTSNVTIKRERTRGVIAALVAVCDTYGARRWEEGLYLTLIKSDGTKVEFLVEDTDEAVVIIKAYAKGYNR